MKIRLTGVIGGLNFIAGLAEVLATARLLGCDGGALASSVVCLNWLRREAKPDMIIFYQPVLRTVP